jgi:hypothetical protein
MKPKPSKESAVRARLVGTWKLVLTEEILKNGSTRPFPLFGQHGKGLLMYQTDGYMSAFLVNSDDMKSAGRNAKSETFAAAFAYSGKYEIDVERKQIVHFPEFATHPGYVGSRQVRPYEFDGDRLIFSDVEKADPAVASWKIIWEKVQ